MPRALRGLDVDHVGPGGRHRDQTQALGTFQRRLAHVRLVGDDDVGVGDPACHLLRRRAAEQLELVREAQGPQHGLGRERVAVEKDDAGGPVGCGGHAIVASRRVQPYPAAVPGHCRRHYHPPPPW